jgi:hypothetical protein
MNLYDERHRHYFKFIKDEDFLPCPFCGSKPHFVWDQIHLIVKCKRGCVSQNITLGDPELREAAENLLLKKWNTRWNGEETK